jgi:hypothetical protein
MASEMLTECSAQLPVPLPLLTSLQTVFPLYTTASSTNASDCERQVKVVAHTVRTLDTHDVFEALRIWRSALTAESRHREASAIEDTAHQRLQHYKCFGAYDADNTLLGFACAMKWGMIGYLGKPKLSHRPYVTIHTLNPSVFPGPIAVDVCFQGNGIAQSLLRRVLACLTVYNSDGPAASLVALHTIANSEKHMHLFTKFGFRPLGAIAIMTKSLTPYPEVVLSPRMVTGSYSPYRDGTNDIPYLKLTRTSFAEFTSNLISSLQTRLPGCDVTREMDAVLDYKLGAVLYFVELRRGLNPTAFAILHHGECWFSLLLWIHMFSHRSQNTGT